MMSIRKGNMVSSYATANDHQDDGSSGRITGGSGGVGIAACCGGGNHHRGDMPAAECIAVAFVETTTKRLGSKNKVFDGTDADLAKEMNALSVEEREQVYEDIHGVAAPRGEETFQFVAKCVEEFDQALSFIPKSKRKPLDRAFFLRPSLVQQPRQQDNKKSSNGTTTASTLTRSDKFKMLFLRADGYDATKAAARMVKFFECKGHLFGEEKLGKDITLEDLDEKDIQAAVLSGCTLMLPNRDQTGRPIILFDISKFDFYKPRQMLRFTWYLFMSALEDEIAQTKGLTIVSYLPQKRVKEIPVKKAMENLMMSDSAISGSLPARVTGYHFCTDAPAMQFILSLLRTGHGKSVRLRLRSHFGSEVEMQYSLLTFGIECSRLLSCGGGKTELHDEFLEHRRQIESSNAKLRQAREDSTGIIDYPTASDALIGRGRPYHDFIGTRRLIEVFIDSQLDRYFVGANNDRFSKTCINMEIVKQFQESGGRFLRRTPAGWVVIDDTLAREKVANLFRYRYGLLRGTKNNNASSSSSRGGARGESKKLAGSPTGNNTTMNKRARTK